ncbi:unnamed protein product [Owenia fusiformis]|uniref:Uncharacterized protein n=1 Tax=Owenia fusiformis TaxID=6347 RepID=A0A8S4PR56_OWEFU|nr:unnamed protein product [Owenia fusiformis]
MNSLTLLVCIVAFAVIQNFASGQYPPCTDDPPDGTCKKKCNTSEVAVKVKGCPRSIRRCCVRKCEPDNGICREKKEDCPKYGEEYSNSFMCRSIRKPYCCVEMCEPDNGICRENKDCKHGEEYDDTFKCPNGKKPPKHYCCVKLCEPDNGICRENKACKHGEEYDDTFKCPNGKKPPKPYCCVPRGPLTHLTAPPTKTPPPPTKTPPPPTKTPPPTPPAEAKYDTKGKSEGLSSSEPEPAGISRGLHSGCFIMYTLTSKGIYSGTDALFSFQFWRWTVFGWQWSPWQPENNPGDDREEGHWDLYGPYPQRIGGLPADWIYVRQTTRFYDRWQIKTIFMRDTCHNILYEYYCNGCWVSNNPNGGTWIKRTTP